MGAPFNLSPPRIVLFPLGTVDDPKVKDQLMAVLIKCGADLNRLLDQRFHASNGMDELDKYIRYLTRMSRSGESMKTELSRSIVYLSHGNPPGLAVIKTRRRMIQALPTLCTAVWCIYVDHVKEPMLMTNLEDPRLGGFDDIGCPAPVWKDNYGAEYLIIHRLCRDIDYLAARFGDVAVRAANAKFSPHESSAYLRVVFPPSDKD